ncbi:MAG: hypothetical protein U0517_02310 [Candidatus Andersenbacteria bacterium]
MVADPSFKWIKTTLLALLKAFNVHELRLNKIEKRLTVLDNKSDGVTQKLDRIIGMLSKKDTEQVALKSAVGRHETRIEKLEIKNFGQVQI